MEEGMKKIFRTLNECSRFRISPPSIIFFFLLIVPQTFAQGGKTGLAFLKLGVGARSIGMGEAHAAIANDASATFYNPSGLVEGENHQILLMHKEWIEGARTEFFGVNLPFGDKAIGLAINTTNVGDIELRTRPGPPEGTFSIHDFALGLSFATKLHPSLNGGLSLKFLYEKIFVDEASGVALDIGLLYRTPIEGLKLAFVAANLGSMGSLREEKIKLPSLIRVGSSYIRELDLLRSTFTAGVDVVKVLREEKTHLHTGTELTYQELVSLRFGYLFGYETRGFTAGLGLRRDFVTVDYGFSPQSRNISNGHTISIGVEF